MTAFYTAVSLIALLVLINSPGGADTVRQQLGKAGQLYQSGQYDKAETLMQDILEQQERQQAPARDHAMIMSNLALVYHAQGRYTDAVATTDKAIAIWQSDTSQNAPGLARAWNNRAEFLATDGQYSEAEASWRQALNIAADTSTNLRAIITENYRTFLFSLGRDSDANALLNPSDSTNRK